MDKKFKIELGFVQRVLPWIIGAVSLILYLVTLNHSASFGGLAKLAQVAGWDWHPTLTAPLHFLLTYPVRWLPAGAQPLALNLIAAFCSSLSLVLLARSVALLPHDRTRDQRQLERSEFSLLSIRAAWVPPVFAALLCGLQLSFWENAVLATGEALDLLLFAWLIHTLLAYRLDQNESRLSRFAFVYGLAVTNNFAMIAFFPAFLTAIIWIKEAAFFNWRFLLKTTAFGILGLLGYLILPAVNLAMDPQGFGFWDLLVSHWNFQKTQLLSFPRHLALLLSFTSILPVLFIGIRWPAQFGDISPAGNLLTALMTHLIHGLFLLACVYVAFDPQFSPRNLGGGRFALLPLYYLGALAVGYCVGYFLLVFGAKIPANAWPRPSALRRIANPVLVVLIWIGVVAVPTGLVVKNWEIVVANTGPALARLATGLADSLPTATAGKSMPIVLSDDPFRLYALRWELERRGVGRNYALVDTSSLGHPYYHRFLHKSFPTRWPSIPMVGQGQVVDPQTLSGVMVLLGERGPLYYLHPSFGYYFENFYQKPSKLVYELKPYPTNSVSGPVLTRQEIQEQDAFWQDYKNRELNQLVGKVPPFVPPGKSKKTVPRDDTTEMAVARMYARSLNHFGVELQRAGDFAKANDYFELALKLNDHNGCAYANRDYNRLFRAGKREGERASEGATNRLAVLGGAMDAQFSANGPIDEPSVCYLMAQIFESARNLRQAAQQVERVLFFSPTNLSARLAMVSLLARIPIPDKALEQAAALRTEGTAGLTENQMVALIESEAWAHAYKNDFITCEKLLREAQAKYPKQITPWAPQLEIYHRLGRFKDATDLLNQQLQLQPTNVAALVNFGYLLIQSQQFSNALPFLDRALALNPRMEQALFNRAIANLRSGRIDAAVSDYHTLESSRTGSTYEIYFGLGECYQKKKNLKRAREYYEKYLAAAPPGLPERRLVEDRLKSLASGAL